MLWKGQNFTVWPQTTSNGRCFDDPLPRDIKSKTPREVRFFLMLQVKLCDRKLFIKALMYHSHTIYTYVSVSSINRVFHITTFSQYSLATCGLINHGNKEKKKAELSKVDIIKMSIISLITQE